MQTTSTTWPEALKGSHTLTARADIWYNGELVDTLDPTVEDSANAIIGGSVESSDDGDAIRHRLSMSVASQDGSLVPRSEYAALAPYGSRVNIRAGLVLRPGQLETVSLGWFRLETATADEHWRIYDDRRGNKLTISGGAKVDVTGLDLAQVIKDWTFMAPESPASLSSVVDEIERLTAGILTVGDSPGVVDSPIWSAGMTYERDRWSAICDLGAILNAVPYINPNGLLALRPDTLGSSVWTITAGNEDSIVVDASPQLSRQGLFNAVVSKGTDDNNLPVQKTILEADGPLRWGGPFGMVPTEITDPLSKDEATAYNIGYAHLVRQIYSRSYPIQVTCACNYALEVGDAVTLQLPDRTLTGRVQSISWPLTPGPMTMTLQVPRSVYWSAWGPLK